MTARVLLLALALSASTGVLRATDATHDLSALAWLADFPKRILYRIDETGALRARAEGGEGARALEWTWRRADR